jgi:glycopeptide antibiotics resistance protein
MESGKRNTLTIVLFAIYVMLLTGIILFKLPFYSPQLSDGIRVINLIPFQGSFDDNGVIVISEIRDNILIFLPFGIYICMFKSKLSFAKMLTMIIGISLSFEVLQFIFALGRTDITDVINNTLGGIIGIGIYTLLFKVLGVKTNNAVNILALIATLCVVMWFAHLFYISHFVMRNLHP